MVTFRPLLKVVQRRLLDQVSECSPLDSLLGLLMVLAALVTLGVSFQGYTLQNTLKVTFGRACFAATDNIGGGDYSSILCSEPVDAVYTWVNGSDESWLREMQLYRSQWDVVMERPIPSPKAHHQFRGSLLPPSASPLPPTLLAGGANGSSSSGSGWNATPPGVNGTLDGDVASASRYRDNGELRYSIRSLHKYAPWLRRIYLVTNGQVPAWLDTSHPRLRVVTHAEIFPDPTLLPVFSSPAIETHIHNIPGLSRRFIYFNDDVMLGAPVWPDSFYTHAQGQKFYPAWEVPKCNTGCVEGWIGDGYCDNACNVSTCLWDGGDCLNNTKVRGGGSSSSSSSSYQYDKYKGGRYEHNSGGGGGGGIEAEGASNTHPFPTPPLVSWEKPCAPSCPNEWLGDMVCDEPCRTAECGWDAGDCGMFGGWGGYTAGSELGVEGGVVVGGQQLAGDRVARALRESSRAWLAQHNASTVNGTAEEVAPLFNISLRHFFEAVRAAVGLPPTLNITSLAPPEGILLCNAPGYTLVTSPTPPTTNATEGVGGNSSIAGDTASNATTAFLSSSSSSNSSSSSIIPPLNSTPTHNASASLDPVYALDFTASGAHVDLTATLSALSTLGDTALHYLGYMSHCLLPLLPPTINGSVPLDWVGGEVDFATAAASLECCATACMGAKVGGGEGRMGRVSPRVREAEYDPNMALRSVIVFMGEKRVKPSLLILPKREALDTVYSEAAARMEAKKLAEGGVGGNGAPLPLNTSATSYNSTSGNTTTLSLTNTSSTPSSSSSSMEGEPSGWESWRGIFPQRSAGGGAWREGVDPLSLGTLHVRLSLGLKLDSVNATALEQFLLGSWMGELTYVTPLAVPPLPLNHTVKASQHPTLHPLSPTPLALAPSSAPPPPPSNAPSSRGRRGKGPKGSGGRSDGGGRGRALLEGNAGLSTAIVGATMGGAGGGGFPLQEEEDGLAPPTTTSTTIVASPSLTWASAAAQDAAFDLRATLAGILSVTPPDLYHNAWVRLVESVKFAEGGGVWPPFPSSTTPLSPLRGRSLGEGDTVDTYAGSLVSTNRLLSGSYGRKVRKVPAHMPHMIDRVAMAKLQAKYPREYAATGARRFRTTQDMQYAFAYFHFLVEGGGREGLDVGAYFSMELDSDGDGVLSDNELYTLGAVTYKRTPTPQELLDLRVCLVGGQGENVTHLTTTSKKHGKGMREVEVRRVVMIREVTWDTIMNCAMVVDALSKNARFGPTAQDMGNAANEEVAFEMVGDDFNKTTEQLDAVRAKRPKFVCLNDNMKVAPPHVIAVLRDFLESYYGTPSPMERPPGSDNPHLYIEPLRRALLVERVWKGVLYVSLGVLVAGGLAVALAVWAERVEEKESKRGGGGRGGGTAGKVGGKDTPASGKRAGSTPRTR